jgi:hypothetical protein
MRRKTLFKDGYISIDFSLCIYFIFIIYMLYRFGIYVYDIIMLYK